jgi:hypothetical protein
VKKAAAMIIQLDTKRSRRPAKNIKSRKPGSTHRAALKRRILSESAATVAHGGHWSRECYPALGALLDAALCVANNAAWRRIPNSFSHEGIRFYLEVTNFGRLIVRTGINHEFVVSSSFFPC